MNVFNLLAIILDENKCAQIFTQTRWYNGSITCPHCKSNDIKKYGKYKIYFQRYFCYNCTHTFNDKTGTIFHYSHISLSFWFVFVWLFCIVSPVSGISIREISKKLQIQYKTSYYMTRKIMQKINDAQNGMTLFGNCEVDELYMHCGMKGKNYHDKIVLSERFSRRRAVKPPPGRGKFSKDFPMIMCYHQRNGNTIFEVPQNYDTITSLVCNKISRGSRINTDEYRVYHSLNLLGYDHHTVNHSLKEYARGDVHTNNCECRTALLRLWMAKHRRVNKFNLQYYVGMFSFLHNIREFDDYSKLIRIISVLYVATRFYIKSDDILRLYEFSWLSNGKDSCWLKMNS